MDDGSDAQCGRIFWDTVHGNELALRDLRALGSQKNAETCNRGEGEQLV